MRTISDFTKSPATCAIGTWAVTSATVSPPPVRHIAKFSTPARAAKNSVWPGKWQPTSCRPFFETGPVTTACHFPETRFFAAVSRASTAARADSFVGDPGLWPDISPTTSNSKSPGRSWEANAARMTSGPMPAGSPDVMPMVGFM